MGKTIWFAAILAVVYLVIATPLYFCGRDYARFYDMNFAEIEAWVGPPTITNMVMNSVYFRPDPDNPKLRVVAVYSQEETERLTGSKIEELRKLGQPKHVYKFRVLEEPAFITCSLPKTQTYFSALAAFLSAPLSCRYYSEPMS